MVIFVEPSSDSVSEWRTPRGIWGSEPPALPRSNVKRGLPPGSPLMIHFVL